MMPAIANWLSEFKRRNLFKVAVAYRMNGQTVTTFPAELGALADLEPVYEELPGWDEDITQVRDFADLPATAQDYVMLAVNQL